MNGADVATAEAALVADRQTVGRFFDKVAMPSAFDACWIWTGSRNKEPRDYGRFASLGLPIYAHRASYILGIGPIPAGLQVDHLCKVYRCVNPLHLEPVTQHVNILRGDSPSARNAVKAKCIRGHLFDEVNTGRQARGRLCLTCKAEGWYSRG